ncbi:MAG: DNA recombination protein RmuC, partial [Pseudomonadota bacterium]
MDSVILNISVLVAGLILGGGAAWFFATRPVADLRKRLDAREAEFKTAIAELGEAKIELATARERAGRADSLAEQLEGARAERTRFAERLASLESTAAEREKAFVEQKRLMVEAREELLNQFKATGAEVLKANQDEFLKRAEARFKQSEETGEEKI